MNDKKIFKITFTSHNNSRRHNNAGTWGEHAKLHTDANLSSGSNRDPGKI